MIKGHHWGTPSKPEYSAFDATNVRELEYYMSKNSSKICLNRAAIQSQTEKIAILESVLISAAACNKDICERMTNTEARTAVVLKSPSTIQDTTNRASSILAGYEQRFHYIVRLLHIYGKRLCLPNDRIH